MRDRLLNDSLTRLASEAAVRLSALVAAGDQIPFDVDAADGGDSLFYSYRPRTELYVREREQELRALPAFGPAREAVEANGIAAAYLEVRGEQVPIEPDERAARMLTVFLASLWDGRTDLALDGQRLETALAALEAETRDAEDADVLLAPLAGLRMPLPRLTLPHGVQIIRADAIEAPAEAMRSEGMERASWQPQFFAIAEQGEGSDSAAAALRQLRELISVMRLFKQGGIGLGPHAFAPTGEDRWRRVVTGAPATRPGGYELSEIEAEELVELATALEARPDPDGALSWAVGRFELGCGRESAMEGISDHLLALRAVLEGKGPVGASLPMRAAALIDGGVDDRLVVRERVEAALELERSLMRGGPLAGTAELATWVEQSVRGMLRDAALGELGADLGTAADETLIATGLAEGDAEIAVTAQPAAPLEPELVEPEPIEPTFAEPSPDPAEQLLAEEENMEDTRILEPVPGEDEIKITATNWLEEVEIEESTLDFPAVEGDVEHRERIDTPRVRHLFPVPEDADWQVRELNYDRHDRRHAG
ncbi:MAG TPA: hypothetical protein VNO20_10655 [Solirubrobacterales bacterium]|nr:hypothetical protein [Solirubrobacterales bacterium]